MHYYNDLSSFFLLIKEVLYTEYSQKYDYNTGSNKTESCRLRPNNIHLCLLVVCSF